MQKPSHGLKPYSEGAGKNKTHTFGAARREQGGNSFLPAGNMRRSSPPSKHVDMMSSSVHHHTEEITRCRLGELRSLLIRSRLPPLIIAPALAPRSPPGPRSAATAGSQVRSRSDCTLHVTKRANCHSPVERGRRMGGRESERVKPRGST